MNITDFDYILPEELIAQTPLSDRTSSRLLVLDPKTEKVQHKKFKDLINYFKEGDCLVLNDTRVMPVRLFGIKEETNAKIELLLLKQTEHDVWESLAKPAKKVKVGTVIDFGEGRLKAICTEEKESGGRVFQFIYEGIFMEILNELGEMPLPPYIKEQLGNQERYQTVYAKEDGSAAAPTAGLHFTGDLLKEFQDIGVRIAYVTLHVGLGTFRPVSVDNVENHHMHSEYYSLTSNNATILNEVKNSEGRIIAVGTTSTRVLETVVTECDGVFQESSGWTDIFIYPPYTFKAIDGLITNFHLPQSTLLMLISALVNREVILNAYNEAIKNNYRFFSFGDAMFILPKEE